MNKRPRFTMHLAAIIIVIGSAFYLAASAYPQNATPAPAQTPVQKGTAMLQHATGTFDVKMTPLTPFWNSEGAKIARMSGDKQFHGDLEGTGKVEMLAGGDFKTGSAGYVAMEIVSGTLHGLKGTFILQHSGTMDKGTSSLTVTVVPGSGTGDLAGISGKFDIIIADGKHSYVFDYTITK